MRNLSTILLVLFLSVTAFVQPLCAQTPSQVFEKSFYPSTTSDTRDVQLDKSGNAYCWGYSGSYYFIIKYNSTGTEQWRLNGVNNYGAGNYSYAFNSTIENLIVDSVGTIYFTGIGYNPSVGNRLSLTKVTSAGAVVWSVMDTTVNYSTNGYQVALDATGNPIVAGTRAELCSKIYVVKYNKTSGATSWAKLFDYSVGYCETIAAIKLDSAGNIYICGDGSNAAPAYSNIFLLKLSATGVQSWLKNYDGNANNDYARTLYVNKAGTIIYVGGYGYFSTTGYDWEILKFDNTGTQLWAKNIDGGSFTSDYLQSFAVDNLGNIFAAGQQYTPASYNSYSILKLNPANGNTLATALVGDPYSSNYIIDIAIDSLNRVYASYSDYDVLVASRFSNNLVNQWTWYDVNNFCYGSSIAVTNAGEAFFIGKNSYAIEPNKIVKADVNGNALWTSLINTENIYSNESMYDYVVDNSGNIYAAAYAGETSNLIVYKLDRNGDVVWKNYFNAGSFHAYDIKLDATGANVYVCGSRNSYIGLIKYDAANGSRKWIASYNAPGYGQDIGYEMALDNNSNIYVTGKGIKSNIEASNIYTLKYNSSGVRQWVADFTGSPGVASDDYGTAIALDASGNAYVGGSATVTNKGLEFTVLKYNTSGVLQYSKLLSGGNFNASDEVYDIAVDNAGNVYAAGYYYSSSPEYYSGVIVKLNNIGGVTFTKQYNGITAQGYLEAVYRIVLNNNNVIGIGTMRKDALANDYDLFTVKLTTAGTQSWIKYYDNTNNTVQNDYGYDVYNDAKGNVYSLGISQDSLWTLIKYDSSGVQQWIYNYDRNTTTGTSYPNYDYRPFLAADAYGAVYVGGTSYKAYSGYNNTFIKFCEYPPVPAITAGGPLTFCAGGSVGLTASMGVGYQWSSGANTQAITASIAGSYTVTVTHPNGCSNVSAKKTLVVNANPTPVITPGGPTTFCNGGTVSLNAGSFTSYIWNNGTTTQTFVADTTGNYRVTVTNSNGCTGSSAQVATLENPLPASTVTVTGSTTFCAGDSVKLTANSGTGIAYQWRKGTGNVAGATAKIYYPKTQGSYTVAVTITGTGCSKISTPPVAVVVNCRLMNPDISNIEMSVYPNPTSGILYMQAAGVAKNVLIKVYDATGKLVYEKSVQTINGDFNYSVDLTNYNQGMYRFELLSGENILRKQAFKIQ